MAATRFLWIPESAVTVRPCDVGQIIAAKSKSGLDGYVRSCLVLGTMRSGVSGREDLSPSPSARGHRRVSIGPNQGAYYPQNALFRFVGVGITSGTPGASVWYRVDPDCVPISAGWASQTGFRNALTYVQTNVFNEIQTWPTAETGEAPEQSVLGPSYETDFIDGATRPGNQVLALIGAFDTWYQGATTKPTSENDIPVAQMNTFKGLVPYWGPGSRDDREALVKRVAHQYLAKLNPSTGTPNAALPTDLNGGLAYLEFKADCKETADRVVVTAQGRAPGYGPIQTSVAAGGPTNRAVPSIEARPGMYAYYYGNSGTALAHTMLVSDIRWDQYGQLVELEVAESNHGGGWGHPVGMVPWNRIRRRGRRVTPLLKPASDANNRMPMSDNRTYVIVDPG